MIYQLLKLDPTWKVVPFLILVGVSISLFPPKIFQTSFFLILYAVLNCRINERAAAYQIPLPISGRWIFAARMISMLAALWAPAGVACIILSFRGPQGLATAGALLGLTALATLIVVTVQSMRISEPEVPLPKVVLFVGVSSLSLIFLQFADNHFLSMPVSAACLLASAILLVRLWRRIPESFQMAARLEASIKPAAAAIPAHVAPADMRRPKALAWWPILRSVYPWQYFIWLPLLCLYQYSGANFPAIMFVVILWSVGRGKIGWLYALPFSRSAILSLFVLPVLLSVAAGYFTGVQFHAFSPPLVPSLRIQILHIAALLAWMLILLCYLEISDWHLFRQLPHPFSKNIWAIPISLCFAVMLIPHFMTDAERDIDFLLLRISGALPDNIFIVIAAAALPLALLYWIADKLFRESELADKPQQATA